MSAQRVKKMSCGQFWGGLAGFKPDKPYNYLLPQLAEK